MKTERRREIAELGLQEIDRPRAFLRLLELPPQNVRGADLPRGRRGKAGGCSYQQKVTSRGRPFVRWRPPHRLR